MFQKKEKSVTIITGYLGAGKTTVLNEILKSQGTRGTAVVVNDVGSVNIDASLIRQNRMIKADTQMIELTNGCICCTLQDAFMEQLAELAKDKNVERILVEASGISDPSAIAAGFLAYQEQCGWKNLYLDSIVCVVDADRIYTEFLDDLSHPEESEQDPDIINLVMDQIEFCNIILLNKCDLLNPNDVHRIEEVIRTLQKDAQMIECIQGKVNPDHIFQGKKFDFDKVMASSRIQQQLSAGASGHIDNEHGISSFVYEERRPLYYDKFMKFLEEDYPETMIRAKGYVWFSDDDVHVQLFEQAGRNASVTIVSNWLAAFPEKERKAVIRENPEILDDWDEIYGDRINQIVFIGKDIDETAIRKKLNQCIYTGQDGVCNA